MFVTPISQATIVPPTNASQILGLLDDSRRRQLPSLVSSSKIIENTYCLGWCPGGMDLFDVDFVDRSYGVLERRSPICDCIQPMHPRILWATKGVIW